jgi:hypothetical protein
MATALQFLPDRFFSKAKTNHGRLQGLIFTLPAAALLACSLLVLLAFGLAPLYAQVQNGTISGTVTDPKGALVPEAAVTVTQTSTGLVLHGQTNHDGLYTFPQLLPGDYNVTIEKSGFNKANTTLNLTVGQTAQVDVALTLGSETQTVNVEAENNAALDAQSSNLDYTVQAKQVDNLPLNGRNPYGLAVLAPGIMPGQNFGVGVAVARGAVVAAATNNFESNGGIGGSNEILLDGVSIIVCCQGQPAVTPSVEVVNQFKVVTSDPPAQYSRTSGAVLNIATKSGTNDFHGDVYDFLRNDKLDAANFFTKRSGVYPYPGHSDFRPPHRENQFGVFVGGPVRIPRLYNGKDHTFFTFGYEGIRNLDPTVGTTTVPTNLMRQGIFTEAPSVVYAPNSYNAATGQRTPIPAAMCNGVAYAAGYCIPSSQWDIVAADYLQFMPAPNLSGTVNNYQYVENIIDHDDQLNFRIDHDLGTRQRLFARGTRDTNTHFNYDYFNKQTGPNAWHQELGAYLFALGDVVTLTPNTVAQFTYGFARQTNFQPGYNFYTYNAGSYGFSNTLLSEQQIVGLPVLSFSGLAQLGYQAGFNHWAHYVHSLNGSVLLTRGKHDISIGYNGKLILENQFGLGNPNGTLSFGTNFTGGPTPTSGLPSGQSPFDSWATFLLGAPTGGSLERQLTTAFNQWWNGVYIQDDYRVFSKLTLNLGLRYDIETGFKERHNNWADFNPAAQNPLGVPGGAQFLCANGNPCRTWETSYHEVSPRFGFAYSAHPATVVRGGYGILFLPTSERGYGDPNIGFAQNTSIPVTATGYTPAVVSENPFPSGVLLPVGPAGGTGVGNGTSLSGFEYNNRPSYQEQWNFGVEQAFGSMVSLNINYAGGHGVDLPMNIRPNDLQPQYFGAPGQTSQVAYLQQQVANPFYGAAGIAPGSTLLNPTVQRVQLLTAFPQYTSGAISGIQNGSLGISYQDIGSTTYNALQTTVLFHNRGGLTGSVSYIWSKLLGNVSDLTNGFLNTTGNPGYQDYYFPQLEHTNLATDIPQRVVGTASYPLPFGHGRRFGANIPGWANEIAGGWTVTTIIDVYSGFPISMGVSGTPAFAGTRPVYVPGVKPLTSGSTHTRLGGAGQAQAYLNPAAFALPLSFQLGNVPRSAAALRGPLSFDDNASILKTIPIRDQVGVELRAEAFNVLNKVDFGLPAATVGGSGFGYITSQYNLPRNLQLALKVHF